MKYETPEMLIMILTETDVITTSPVTQGNGQGGIWDTDDGEDW